jgi:ABC-2 type transport system ATP-binding protein
MDNGKLITGGVPIENVSILTTNLGKRFNREWIFRNVNLKLESGQRYAFVGPNGCGKSTLLQVLSGVIPLTEGGIVYQSSQKEVIAIDNWYKNIVIAAPYLELIEEFSPLELLQFHEGFKPFKNSVSAAQIIANIELDSSRHKPIKYFSSGMKQRLKLALAFWSDVPVVMLDEPTSNLDARWASWYLDEVQKLDNAQIVLICSNMPNEYAFCEKVIVLSDYK